MQVVQFLREFEHKVAARHHVLRVAAVDRVSGEDGRIAKVLEAAAAVRASSVYAPDPGNANARAKRQVDRSAVFNNPYDLVAGDELLFSRWQFALDDVHIGTADAAGAHTKQNLTRCGLRLGHIFDLKRLFCGFEDGGSQSFRSVGQFLLIGYCHLLPPWRRIIV